MKNYDVVIIGAGASGLMAAAAATARGRRVAVIDMGITPARKVMVSGGGGCNFTNGAVAHDRYFGANPDFVRGAIARFRPSDMLAWMRRHNLSWREKSAGQYFCATGAADVVGALLYDARAADIFLDHGVTDIDYTGDKFIIRAQEIFCAQSVIIATGGTSFPTLTVSDIGYMLAKKFGHKIVPVRPALCAIRTDVFLSELAGISIDAEITIGRRRVRDAMLFTHFGIGGPAAYRASLSDMTDGITINLLPDIDVYEWLRDEKRSNGRKSISSILSTRLPARLAKWITDDARNIADMRDAELRTIADKISAMRIPAAALKLHGLAGAEVVRGGVSTADISSKTMESKLRPGLFFAGEVMDIAGDLGGFNLHWAWASGNVAGTNA